MARVIPHRARKPGLLQVWLLLLTAALTTASLLALTWHQAQHDEAELMPLVRMHMPRLKPRSTLDPGKQTAASIVRCALLH